MPAGNANQRGLSLIEALVATVIMSLAIVVALTVYDASRKAFSKGENATEQQESVRIAFDRMTSDLRMLGHNINPDGDPDRPDEPLEGALDHAVILRADLDRSDATASVTPEAALAGGAFSNVSTGNDEIVAYVLSNPDGTGPDTITFQADVHESPRDGHVEDVAIGNVVLDPTAPPYTLYRVTLNNDGGTYGSPGFVVRTPVVENVRDLSFVYHGAMGTFKDAAAAVSEAPEAKAARNGLTRIGVSLVGMTRQQDASYDDASDAAAPRYRKFELKGDVTPRNLRFKGIQDLNADLTPPTKPATPSLVPGHCGGLIATWPPNPASEGVTQYKIYWGPSGGVISGIRSVSGSPFFLDGLTTGATWFVSVQAQDAQGNMSMRSDPASAMVANSNTPSAPTGLMTSTDQTYRVRVTFTPVTTNTASVPAADPQAPRVRDLAGYRLYWYFGPSFSLADAYPVVDEHVLGPSFQPPYDDTPLAACVDRYYTMTAVDTCGRESAPTPISRGRVADAHVKPNAPIQVQAHFVGANTARVKWAQIKQDASGNDIRIQRYEIFRSAPIDGALPPASAVWDSVPVGVEYSNAYLDNAVPSLTAGQVIYYRVTGGDDCGNESDPSPEARLDCAFTGDVEISTPHDGEFVSGAVPTTATVSAGTGPYAGVTITYVHSGGGPPRIFTSSTSGPPWTDTGWTASPVGHYTITATVTNGVGCSQFGVIDVTAIPPSGGGP